MNIIYKLILVPCISFFLMMFSAALISDIYGNIRELPWLFPNQSALNLFLIWNVVLTIFVILQHFFRKKKVD